MVVLIYFCLMISDVAHLFTCRLAICMSSWEKYLFGSSAHTHIEELNSLSSVTRESELHGQERSH